jgi:hypothetical protein
METQFQIRLSVGYCFQTLIGLKQSQLIVAPYVEVNQQLCLTNGTNLTNTTDHNKWL